MNRYLPERLPECEFCFGEDDVRRSERGELECKSCREYSVYWFGLSDEEKRREHESVARHVQDQIDRGEAGL